MLKRKQKPPVAQPVAAVGFGTPSPPMTKRVATVKASPRLNKKQRPTLGSRIHVAMTGRTPMA